MRVRKDLQQNLGLINTIRNINKLNPSHNINLTNIQFQEKNKTIILQKTSPNNNIPIKVKLVKSNQSNQNQKDEQNKQNFIQYNKLSSPQKKNPISHHMNKSQISKTKNKNKLCNSSSKIVDDDPNINNNVNINQTDINKLRHSLIYIKEKEKQMQMEKQEQENKKILKNERKYISMSPKLVMRFNDEKEEGINDIKNTINRGFVIKNYTIENEHKDEDDNDNKNKTNEKEQKQPEHKIRNLLSKNFPYNKPKPSNKVGSSYYIVNKKQIDDKKNKINQNQNQNQLSGETMKSNNQNYNDDAISISSFNKNNNNMNNMNNINNINNMNNINNNNNMLLNSPRTTASYITDLDNNNFNNNFIRNTQQNRYYKISNSPNRNPNMNRTSYNYYNNNQNISNNRINYNNNINNMNINLDIKLEDLIMIEERLNDICISLNNNNNTNDVGASNECIEFFVFYFHSSLTYKFPLLFFENKRILIQSAINLKLFTIVMTYHLSMNIHMLSDVLIPLKNIYSLLKLNLYLFIKKLQIFYGEAYVSQNEIYFKTFNYLLARNGYNNMNENEIVDLIQNNCYNIVQMLSDIINYYESVGNIYYLDFLELFNTISKLTEKEINNYFYNYLYAARGKPPLPKMEYHPLPVRLRNNLRNNFYINNQTINNFNNININTLNNINNDINKNNNMNNSLKNQLINNNILYNYQKNKISPPFLTSPCTKKYTLVLDINDTLINIQYSDNNNGQVLVPNLRPGLFSFLGAIKPFYELISFTTESKEYSDIILKEIEKNRKYFDYNLYKEHCTLYGNKFVKDISKLGRDIKKIIIVDDDPNNFILNPENGIQISPYLGDSTKDDTTLFELKKLLILFHRTGGEDIRKAIKAYEKDIKEKISLNNNKKF